MYRARNIWLNRVKSVLMIDCNYLRHAVTTVSDGVIDVQDNVFRNASVLERPDPDACSSSSSGVIRRPAADCPKNEKRVRSPGIFGRGPSHLELITI